MWEILRETNTGTNQSSMHKAVWWAVAKTNEKVSNSLESASNKKTSLLDIFKKYPFIKNHDWKIVAEFTPEVKKRKSSLLMFLKDLSKASYYITDLTKYFNLNDIFDKEIWESETIILWTWYQEIEDNEVYLVASVTKEKDIRTYHFNKFVDTWGKLGTDIDKFVSNLYRQWIVYWYDYEAIDKWFQYLKWKVMLTNSIIQIAKESNAINWINSKLHWVSLKINSDTRSKDLIAFWLDTKRQIDTKTYINTTFDVKKWEILQVKIPHKKWKHWFKVTGEVIKANEWIDKDKLEEKFLEWFEIINVSWKKFIEDLISDGKNYEAWKVAEIFSDILYIENPDIRKIIANTINQNFWKNGERVVNAILKKYSIDPETIVNVDVVKAGIDWTYQAKDKAQNSFVILETLEKSIIDAHSWNIHKILPDKEFIVSWEEDRDIKWLIKWIEKGWRISWEYRKLTINWNIYWTIEVSGNTEVVVNWNMSWWSKIIHNWTGFINIDWMISADALVDAKNSEIHISNLENWIVIAWKIQIDNLSNWTLLSKEITIDSIKNRENSKLDIIWEKIQVKNLESRWITKAILLCEKISPDDLIRIKNATDNEIRLEDRNIDEILNSPELLQHYDKLSKYKHNYSALEQLIWWLIKSRELVVEWIKNQLEWKENSKEIDDKISNQIANSKIVWSDVIKKNRLKNRHVRFIHKLNQHLINLRLHIEKISEKKAKLELMSWDISKSSLSVKSYLWWNSIELYTYDYITKVWDIYTDINPDEISYLIAGNKAQDNIYRKIPWVLTKSNFNWPTSTWI